MLRVLLGVFISLFISGCVGGTSSGNNLIVPLKNDKTAELEYVSTGVTSEFKFDGIIKGTYKDISSSAGFIVYTGKRTLTITTKAYKSWTIDVRSEKKDYLPYGKIIINTNEPYVATIKENNKRIGDIVLMLEDKVDTKNSVMKTIGLNTLVNTNMKFVNSKANILGVNYEIKSIYENDKDKITSNPIAYEVLRGKKSCGLVVVGKNAFGGRTMTIWIKDKQSKLEEQSVATILTVVGYSSLPN